MPASLRSLAEATGLSKSAVQTALELLRRRELIDELEPYVERDDEGAAVTGETDRSRFSASKDVSFVRLRPERVLEVRYDQLEGMRFRHTVQFERWRPDRDAASCTFDQLETVGAYDLGAVLAQTRGEAPAVLLAHEPDLFPRVPPRLALTLSGHTHGGQVRLFGHSPVVPSRYGNRYAYGLVEEDGRRLIVSGGLGCSIVPLRFGVPPELTLVHLV